ncbi:MAG: leucine-rich repeat domain-containing protein [Oscillospiraceae bacterium]|nr:leucine-rich repeat domain-containing protein [Oscillospiraceae bacterium]
MELNASGNQLINLPESIGKLSQLIELNISRNQLTSLPESIGKLSQFTELNVFEYQLTNLLKSIRKLSQFTVLDVSENQLTSLPEWIRKLSQLTVLDVSGSQLTNLPESIGELSQLTELNVSGNQLTSLPESIEKLSQLNKLYISQNQLTSLPEWIERLSQLTELDVSNNQLTSLPEWIGAMTSLHTLNLSFLQLREFPDSLLQLNIPFLADNRLSFYSDRKILIKDTKLSIQPVALFDQSRDKSLYYQESRKLIEDYFNAAKRPIREAKVIFLGDGKVGKTYTIQRLLHNCRKGDYPTKETHGILIEDLVAEKCGGSYKVRVWDFGGQDIMHEMHRCFLTDRTCYVVMVDTRADKQTGRARYWLRTIQSIAPNAPALLLVNEISGGKNRDLDYSGLKQEFSNLAGVEYCSSMDASDEEFRQKVECFIFQQALDLDSCKIELPESWENVRQNLLRLQNGADPNQEKVYYIDRQAFYKLCDQYSVPSDDGLRAWLLTWFNDLGVCFSYHLTGDGMEQAADYKILEPMWLTSAVYKIIWEKQQTDNGLISLSEIYRILEKPGSEAMKKDGIPCLENVSYNKEECGYVLDIMRMFRISYPADANTEFMPTLCNPNSNLDPVPKTWEQHAACRFRYTFLPENVLHRLMIYCFANLRPGKRWRRGFWLECEPQGLSAVIRTTGRDSEENELQIDVYSQTAQYEAWTWLQPLCRQITEINKTLSLKAEVSVLAENDCEEAWFTLDRIWYWKKQGVPTIQGERSLFSIQSLMKLIYGSYLSDVEDKVMTEQNRYHQSLPSAILSQTVTAEIAERTGVNLSIPFEKQLGKRLVEAMEYNNDLHKKEIEILKEHAQITKINTAALQESTLTVQQLIEFLQNVRDGRTELSAEVLTDLGKEFSQSDNPILKAAGEKMSLGENKGQLFRDLLGDASNFITIGTFLGQLSTNPGSALLKLIKSFALTCIIPKT